MADQEFLASFGVEIDESGVKRLQTALSENRTLAEELARAFDRARESVQAFFSSLGELSKPSLDYGSARVTEESSGLSIPLSLDFTKANKDLAAFLQESTKAFKLSADASGVVAAGRSALSTLQTLYGSTKLKLTVQEEVIGLSGNGDTSGSVPSGSLYSVVERASSVAKAATGGRFSSPTMTEIAEDGDPEYVIPVKKESIAVHLLGQLFGELSASARETLASLAGEKEERQDALSGLPDMLASAPAAVTPVVNQTNTSSVQAPVSINVTAAGSDPAAVGKSVYNVAEQYLLRTLNGE